MSESSQRDSSQCETIRLAAMAIADNESPDTNQEPMITAKVVQQHLEQCEACREALAGLAAVDARFAGVERQRHEAVISDLPRVVNSITDADSNPAESTEGVSKSSAESKSTNETAANTRATKRRWLPSVTAIVLLIGFGVWLWQSSAAAGPTFGEVIRTVQKAKSLKLNLKQNGRSQQVLVSGKDSLRLVESANRYQIAKGEKLWRVDERTKRFNIDKATFFNADGLNLFELIGITIDLQDATELEATTSPEVDGWIYRLTGKRGSQDVDIEAVVAKNNGYLRSIRVLSIEDNAEPFVICELAVESFDEVLDESMFVVAKTLTEDFRVGRIVDSEGVVTVKPVMHERWTPVSREMVLKRGDWIRTDPRGPNAVAVRVKNAKLTLGPGSMVELIDHQQARVHRGEVKVEADNKKTFDLIAGKADALKVEGKKLLRLAGDVFKVLTDTPQWLAGFEGTQSDESLGSLIADVDGRSVSLTVGYHKVTVEIRDQIARTTIEESFVNHTNSQLEGQFYFPLPQDASISGFGMWIGDELVEADVVEKQRAREIFETILREKRDPGLLEWTGGNIFKARVFPIFPHSEKRIKITYTQVLPLRGSKYRYTYGLRSELLKQTPLRELSIDLKVYSESKLRQINCPSHVARIEQTEHSGHIEFSAEEYSPDADFEAVIEIDNRSNDVVVIPHQRGDDGYFMLQLTPPGVDGNWQRDLLPDGQPLKLLVLADTSSSMDSSHRKTQDEFIAALLLSLGPQDQFNLAACDVDCDWAFDEAQDVGDASNPIEAARDFLGKRVSLGWTDLDRAFESVLKQADRNTHVVYIGDGVVTAGSADPDEFVNRLKRLTTDTKSTFHAVTVGSSYETVVLKSIASVGGGSLRQVNAELGPQDIAKELLSEITQPGLTDLNVEIRGVRVARMYPDELPNIAAGTQHIIIGRYLPEGKDQRGEIVVTAKRGDETVRFKARFTLKDAEAGNSFIPRLWAREHLDQLLSQGRTAQVQDDVIALSEEYHIMTPYTSLLVLESDADRERFKVKRRFMMRDGEKFFAEGRKKANYELLQKQMKLAGLWRANLRAQILKSFGGMGRNASVLNPWQLAQQWNRGSTKYGKNYGFGDYGLTKGKEAGLNRLGKDLQRANEDESDSSDFDDDSLPADSLPDDPTDDPTSNDGKRDSEEFDRKDTPDSSTSPPPPSTQPEGDSYGPSGGGMPAPNFGAGKSEGRQRMGNPFLLPGNHGFTQHQPFVFDGFGIRANNSGGRRQIPKPQTPAWLVTWFPQVGPPNKTAAKPSTWPKAAIDLANSILRIDSLGTIHGLEVKQAMTGHDSRWQRVSSFTSHQYLHSKDRWLNYITTPGSTTNVYFCDLEQRGVYSRSTLLGRVRKAEDSDRVTPILPGSDHSLRPLHQTFSHLNAKIEDAGDDRKRLVLTHVDYEFRILIDTERHVILETEEHRYGKQQNRVVFSDFKTIAGRSWAAKIETHRILADAPRPEPQPRANANDDLHLAQETALEFRVLNAAAFAKTYDAGLADQSKVQFLQMPMPSSQEARDARTSGTADFEDQIVLADYFQASGQWERVEEHLTALETLAGNGKPGMWFLRNAVLRQMNREPMRLRILERAREVAAKPSQDDFYMAGYLVGQMQQVTAHNEQLGVLEILKPVYDRQPEHVGADRAWMNARVAVFSGLGRNDLVLELRHKLAVEFPWDISAQTTYAYALINYRQDRDAAIQWLRKSLKSHSDKWTITQDDNLRNVIASFLEASGRYAELLEHTQEWAKRNANSYNVHARLLTAMIWNDKLDEAETTIRRWLEEGVAVVTDQAFDDIKTFQPNVNKILPQDVSNRMTAALGVAMGQGYNLYTHRIDPKWIAPLSKVVFAFARQPSHRDYANRIVSHGHFVNTNEANLIRQQVFEVLTEELATLPLNELQTFLNWTLNSSARIEREQWVEFADRLETRWAASKTDSEKHQLGSLLSNVLARQIGMEQRLAFLRRQIKEGSQDYRESYITSLFTLLLAQPAWHDKFEAEAFSWLPKLKTGKTGLRMATVLPALYRLSDQMISQRYQTALKGVDQKTKANRIEYRKKQYELYRAARAGYLTRLAEVTADAEDWLAEWMKIEHIYLSIKQGDDLKQQTQLVRKFIGEAPPAIKPPVAQPAKPDATAGAKPAVENPSPEELAKREKARLEQLAIRQDELIQEYYSGAIRHRYVLTAAHLASLRSTSKLIARALLKYVDAGIGMNPPPKQEATKNGKPKSKPNQAAVPNNDASIEYDPRPALLASNMSWKSAKYRLLIALDRPQELERDLRSWIKQVSNRGATDGKTTQAASWRLPLARLLAEQGRLDEAVRLYKAVEHADELQPAEYRALSDWYLALDNGEEYENAKFMYYATMRENSLSQLLNQQIRRYQATDGTAPATLDTDILLMVRALLEKSAYPANYLHQVRTLYATTKDFRLFKSLPIAALGQTTGHAYNMVSNCQYAFSAVLEEATVDELVQLLRSTREQAESEVDRRALDLLEVIAERRAVELQNQAGPHVRAVLAALQRAFQHEWAEGEHLMMMNFLSNLRRLPQDELAAEQRRQMKQLYAWSKAGTFERLQMANYYSNVLWSYDQQPQALIELETAIFEFDLANDSKWPQQGNGILDNYFSKLQQKGRYAEVEKLIINHLTRPHNRGQITHFENRLDRLYYDALANGAQVSLGEGQVLYRAYLARLLKRLENADDNLTSQLVAKVFEILNHAKRLKWANAIVDFKSFAYDRIPKLLKRSTNNYRSILKNAGNHVKTFLGATEAIRYMLDRIDQDPARFRYRNDDAWNHHAGSLAGWLYHVINVDKKKLPKDLDARLLKMALVELRRDLTSHQQRGRYFYGHNYTYLWKAHRADFILETEKILKNRDQTGDSVVYIAAYLYQILEHDRCIEILFDAHRKKLLTDSHISTLVNYLHAKKRFGESIPLLEGLVDRSPNLLQYRTQLMHSYFHVERQQQMLTLLQNTHDHFHKENRWTESTMSHLAGACANCQLWEQCATYYSNAIMERRRTNPASASGDGTVSSYYSSQAEAYLQLGKTKEAVDAAASGIVSWGRNQNNRNAAVSTLQNVFVRVKDRDEYAIYLDAEAKRTQKDRPVVRKALGLAYQGQGEHAKAAAQLKIAIELQPNDAATHTALIDCYDSLNDQNSAIAATLAFLQFDRRNVQTYARLGERWKEQTKQQERAFTGMVEMKPNEADSHTLLAEIRQRQDRWDLAIDHWQHVARIRSLEPTGLYQLISAQIHEGRIDDANRSIKKLEETNWPKRFGSVKSSVDRYRRDIKSKRANQEPRDGA
jgi:hypothetical protein